MRGDGRIFRRTGSPYWWCAYYDAKGQEQREVCLNRKGERLLATAERIETEDAQIAKEAKRFLKARLGAVIAEKHGGPVFAGPAAERVTVDDLLDALKSNYEQRHKWNERVESTVKAVRERFGSWRAVAVTAEDVDKWQVELQGQGYKDATINRFCQILGQAFKLAVSRKRLASAPVITHLSETGNARQGFFTELEMNRVIANLPEYLRDFVRFAYITGMRKSGIASLQWSGVHGDQITLPAVDNKTDEALTIPLEGELAEIIERRRAARLVKRGNTMLMSEFIFHRNGMPIASIRKAWATATKRAGVPGKLFHDLRRCAAKNLVEAGVPIPVAMRITGHKTISMFQRYAIIEPRLQREALRQAEVFRAEQLAEQLQKQQGQQGQVAHA